MDHGHQSILILRYIKEAKNAYEILPPNEAKQVLMVAEEFDALSERIASIASMCRLFLPVVTALFYGTGIRKPFDQV